MRNPCAGLAGLLTLLLAVGAQACAAMPGEVEQRRFEPIAAEDGLRGSNHDAVWSDEEPAVRIVTPWWRTLWVRLLGAALLLAAGAAALRQLVRRYRRRERELQQRVEAGLAELRRSEKRYRKLFERNLAGVVRATVDGRILDCNDAFARIFGYASRGECRSRHQLRFGPEEEHAAMLERLRAHESHESTVSARDGSRVTLLWNAHLVEDESAEGPVIEGTVVDLSERQRSEERLRREQKLESLEVLAGGIAHDFNNLLVGILGNAELALLKLEPGSPIREFLDEIEATAHRAAVLAKKMLAYSGKGRFVIASLDLSRAVDEAVPLVTVPGQVTVEPRLARDLPAVDADTAQIHQLLANLITNAAEALGDAGGVIEVTTGARHCDRRYLESTYLDEDLREGLYVFIEVRDNGPGMEAEVQARIFDPFYTTKFPGRGLGLPVVLGIVRGHHGALEITSEPGRGTTVRVLLPASEAAVTEPAAAAVADEAWRGSGKVLVIDDEAVVRGIARQMLEILGFEVLVAGGGEEGVELFRRQAGDVVLVVLDLTMPRMSGEEAFRALRQVRRDVPVLLASGYEEQEATERFDARELAGFIQKPFQLATLREKVRRALES